MGVKPKRVKPFPHSTEAEEAIIGSILLEGNSIFEKCNGWIRDSDAFYHTKHKLIWEAFEYMHRSGEMIDTVTVLQNIKDNDNINENDGLNAYYISGLPQQVPTTANVEHYSRIVWEKFIKREAIKSAHKLYNTSLDRQEEKAEELLYEHARLINELMEIAPSKKKEIGDIVNDTVDTLKTGKNIIKFGYKPLDNIAGGMTRKEITVIGGRPGHGKTTLTTNLARSLLNQGYKVMLFNREMSNAEMIKKFFVMESEGLSYEDLRVGDIEKGRIEVIEMMADELKEKLKNLIMYDDIRTLSDAIREIQREKPDVIIDDYIQLVKVENKRNKDRRFEIEEILTEYKWVCKKENCSAILVSQLNREIEKRLEPRPKMSDFSESGAIEQTAETALFVFYGYNFDDEKYDKHMIEVICDKARYGKIGSYVMGFNGSKCRFYEHIETAREEAIALKNKNKVQISADRALDLKADF
jgi:replicative DNA helicase